MKVFSDAPNVSALDTWLRDGNTAEATQTASAAADTLPAAANTTLPRDIAEALLDADIWDGAPPSARQLAAATPEPLLLDTQQAASAAQRWAEHIFAPLR
jgi:hypothetical protein